MEQNQDITKVSTIIKRRKWWLFIPFLAVVVLAAAICLFLPNMYRSTATILIRSQQIPPTLVPSTVTSYAEQRIQTITQEVMSRSKILKLIDKFNLLPDKREKLTTEEMVEKIRNRITLEPINAEINKETRGRPILLTIAFTLSYEDEDPKKAQLVTNELSSYYMEKNLKSREEHARGTTKFLEEQLKQVREQVDELETKLAEFRKKHLEELPEFTNLNMQKLEKLNSDISNINMQIRSLEEQRATLRNRLASLDPYSGGSERVLSPEERLQQAKLERAQLLAKYSAKHPLVLAKDKEIALLEKQASTINRIGYLETRKHELELKLADLKSKYSNKHPSVRATARELDQVKKEIEELRAQGVTEQNKSITDATNPAYIAIKSDLDKITVSIASLKAERKRLERQINSVYKKLHAMPEVAKKYNELDTDYQNAKMHYQELQQKLLTARVAQGMEEDQLGETFQVIEPAFLPEKPAKPNRLAIMLIGVVLGIGISIGLAAIREYTDRTIREADILEEMAQAPVLSIIPRITTPAEIRARRLKKVAVALLVLAIIGAGVAAFNYYVMDLYVFWAKLTRLIQSRILI